MPGCIHADLLAAGKIPDPFYRDNEKAVQWVGESDWRYRRTFDVPEAVLENDRVLLRCAGLDTLATVKINGREVGRADNMFRLWEFDVKSDLRAGEREWLRPGKLKPAVPRQTPQPLRSPSQPGILVC